MNSTPAPNGTPLLVWSILVTVLSVFGICWCLPVLAVAPGIVAIVFAAKIGGMANRGDVAGAQAAAKTAKTWCWVATAVLVVTGIVSIAASAYIAKMPEYQQMMEQIKSAQP